MRPSPTRSGRARLPIVVAVILALAAVAGSVRARADTPWAPPFPISSSWPPAVQRFITVEESAPMVTIVYKYGTVTPGAGGCYSTGGRGNCGTTRRSWAVEWQRMGFRDVVTGIYRSSPALVSTGLRIFRYAFEGEAADGSFPGSAGPFHGTAMFLAEAAPALIVLKYSPMGKRFAVALSRDTAKVRLAARYVYKHGRHIETIDTGATDRYFEAALALEASGLLSGDRRLERWSHQYVRGGIHRERPDGLLPEWGGHDAFYQALGMVDACRYLLMIPPGKLEQRLKMTLRKGIHWELTRIAPDGSINAAGDTRSKTPFAYSVVSALSRWSVIGDVRGDATLAEKVWKRYY